MSSHGETQHPSEPEPAQLQKEVVAARHDLDRLVGELDRRRHALFDVPAKIRQRPVPFILGGLAVLTVIGGTVALVVLRRRRHNAWPQRVQRLRHAIAQAVKHPDRAHDEPSPAKKIGTASGTAVASVLAKAVAERLLRAARDH
jgi:hypothetical protein